MVEHSLYLAVKRRGVHIVLLREFRQQKARIVQLRVGYGIDKALHQKGYYTVTGKLYVHNFGGAVNLLPRQSAATLIGGALGIGNVL